jgi:dihydrofolate synthase/folylpolyglutamate synthase
MPAEARKAVLARARAIGARVVEARRRARFRVARGKGHGTSAAAGALGAWIEHLDLRTPEALYEGLRPLPGAHQRDNLLVAIRLLEEAKHEGLPVRLPAVARAVARTRWPGRLEWIAGDPPLLLDGAHNPAGARALARALADGPPYVLVFAAMSDKDIGGLARALFPRAAAVVLTRPRVSRAAAPSALARRAGALARGAHREPVVFRALALARRLARAHSPRTIVVVAGSLYLVGAVAAILERRGRA